MTACSESIKCKKLVSVVKTNGVIFIYGHSLFEVLPSGGWVRK